MPDSGTRDPSSFDGLAALGGADPWELPGARLVQLTYEVAKDAALAALPATLSRPVPCYARVSVIDAPSAPAGPFRAALLLLGARHLLLPGSFLVDLVVEGEAGALGARLGGVPRAGRIAIEREAARVRAEIAADEGPLARLELPALEAVPPGMLRFDPWLALARDGERRALVRTLLEVGRAEAFLARRASLETAPGLPRRHAWRSLASLGTISAAQVEGDLRLAARDVAG
jgi:hypothetical protein